VAPYRQAISKPLRWPLGRRSGYPPRIRHARAYEGEGKGLEARAKTILAVDYFVALGVPKTASPDDVQRAFLEAVKTWHPDRVPSGLEAMRPVFAQVFGRLEVARATLADPARKLKYVEELTRPQKRASASDISSAEATLEFKKAEAFLKRNDMVQAEAHLRRARELAPANVDIHSTLISVRAKPTSTPEELKVFLNELDDLLKSDPKCARAYFVRGQLRKRLGLLRESCADFEQVVQLEPSNIDATREVRLYKMRLGGAASPAAPKPAGASDGADGEAPGVAGFFKKLFKR
jgi:tetratricopeptide (TPR) repeat protein